MSDNFYAAPDSRLDSTGKTPSAGRFYLVSQQKFLIMLVGSGGIYLVYWCWKNWHLYRQSTGQALLPLARALFHLFFFHSLLQRIDQTLQENRQSHAWKPRRDATMVVVLLLLFQICGQLAEIGMGRPFVHLLLPVLLLLIGIQLLPAQKAINLTEGDIHGAGNHALTPANYLWLLFGAVYWLSVAMSMFGLLPQTPAQ